MDARKAQERLQTLEKIEKMINEIRNGTDIQYGSKDPAILKSLQYHTSSLEDLKKDPLNQTKGYEKLLASTLYDVTGLHDQHGLWGEIKVDPEPEEKKQKTPKASAPEKTSVHAEPKVREDKHHERKEKKEPAVATQIDPRLPPIAVAAQKADQILKGNGTPAMVQFRFKELALANSLWGKAMQVFGPIEKVQHGTPYIVRLSQQVYSQLRQADAKLPKFDQLPQAPMSGAGPQVTPDEPKKTGPKR